MTTAKPIYRDPIVWHSEKLGYQPSIRGTDVSVAHVLRFLAEKPDLDALLEAYPQLTIEDIQATFAFAAYAAAESPRPVQLTPATTTPPLSETTGEALLRLARIGGKGPTDLSMRIDEALYGPDA